MPEREQIQQVNRESVFVDGVIPKKAFLGNRRLERMVVPGHIRRIEDWAFAHCKGLREIWIPKQVEYVGRDVFMGCDLLEKMVVYAWDMAKEDIRFVYEEEAALLALAIRHFPFDGIYDMSQLGTDDWYRQYDRHLLDFLKMPDDRNFDPFLAGGEEDYEDPRNNREYYCTLQRQVKCKVCMERLLQGKNMEYGVTKALSRYLLGQEDVMLSVLLEKRENAYPYFKRLADENILTMDNIDRFLQKLSGEVYAESRAFLLEYKLGLMDGKESKGIWSQLQL